MNRKSTAADKRHMGRVADLGCIVCLNNGYPDTPAEFHHSTTETPRNNMKGIPLCPWHHRTGGYGNALHAGKKFWQSGHGTELELLEQVDLLLTGE